MPWFLVPYGVKLGWFFRGGGRGGPPFSSNFRQLKFRQKPPRFRTPRPSFCPPKKDPLFAKNPILFYEPSRQKSFFYPQKTPENPPRGTPGSRSKTAVFPPEKHPEFSESVNREISSFFLIFSKNHKKNIFFEKSEKRMFCAETSMKNLWFLSFFRRKFSKI